MALYLKADALDRAAQDFQSINTVIDLIASHIANTDLTEPDELKRIIDALVAVSDIAETAHARAAAALAEAYSSPHDFDGPSFRA